MKNALLPRILALAKRAQAAHKAMNDSCHEINACIDWDQRNKNENEMYAEMDAINKEAGKGLAVGRHLSFGVGDGGADYIITKINKTTVQVEWIPLCDGYFSDAVSLTPDKTKLIVLRGTAEHQCKWNDTTPTMFA